MPTEASVTSPIAEPVGNPECVHTSASAEVAAPMPTDAESPVASNKAAMAIKLVLNEVQKTSGTGGGTVQTNHGNE
jgi:hypothetical protein